MASSYEVPNRATEYETPKQVDKLQTDVNQVVTIMKDNLEQILERDTALNTLENRTDHLEIHARNFQQTGGEIKRKYWWKNVKMWAILITVIVILIVIIIVAIVLSVQNNNQN